MAQHQISPDLKFTPVVKTRATSKSAAVSTHGFATPANYASMSALDTRLLALGYTQANIDRMNANDKQFAVRAADDAGTI